MDVCYDEAMKVDFNRFPATDGVELQGWYSDAAGDTAVIHVHGKSGNGYENHFLDTLRERYAELGVSFFAFDNRGRGVESYFPQEGALSPWGEGTKRGGSCYELFEESAFDVQGAVDFVKSQGKDHLILQGHSLGGPKVVNYLLGQPDSSVKSAILLAPTDMSGWAAKDPEHEANLRRAHQLQTAGQGETILGTRVGLDKDEISAQAYIGMYEAGTPVDIYGDREGGPLLRRLALRSLIVYGSQDIGITTIDRTINHWLERTGEFLNKNTEVKVIDGASHSFRGYENQLADIISAFVRQMRL